MKICFLNIISGTLEIRSSCFGVSFEYQCSHPSHFLDESDFSAGRTKISVEDYCNYLTRSLKDNNCGENLADIGKTIYEPNELLEEAQMQTQVHSLLLECYGNVYGLNKNVAEKNRNILKIQEEFFECKAELLNYKSYKEVIQNFTGFIWEYLARVPHFC